MRAAELRQMIPELRPMRDWIRRNMVDEDMALVLALATQDLGRDYVKKLLRWARSLQRLEVKNE